MTSALHWIQATRPLSQSNIAIPLLVGQAAAYHSNALFDWHWCVSLLIWGLLDQWFIVFANDYADRDGDTKDTTLFSGGSGVIPQGKISAKALKKAAIVSALGLLGCTSTMAYAGRPLTLIAFFFAIVLVWAYSYPPISLSYRGGGAWLQGVGVGVVLPALGYYVQANQLDPPLPMLVAGFILGVAGNVTTAIPDVEVDRITKKTTLSTRWGVDYAKIAAATLIASALVLMIVTSDDSQRAISIGSGLLVFGLLISTIGIGDSSHLSLRSVWLLSFALIATWAAWGLSYLYRTAG